MEIGQTSVALKRSKLDMIPGDYSMIAYTEATQKKILQEYAAQNPNTRASALQAGTTTWEAPQGYPGGNYDHVANFFQAIRGNRKVIEDPTFGLRAAGAALLANQSYYQEKPVGWNPDEMKLA